MKIRMLTSLVPDGHAPMFQGVEYDVDDGDALVAAGWAEPVKTVKKPAKSKADG